MTLYISLQSIFGPTKATGKMRTCGSADFLDLKRTKPNYKPNNGPNSNPNADHNTKQTNPSLNLSP